MKRSKRHINKIRYEKAKQNRIKGQSGVEALLNAGFSEATAKHHSKTVLESVDKEILEELKLSDITPIMVLKRLDEDRQHAFEKGDISTMTRVDELLGKYLALFVERRIDDVNVISQEDVKILNHYCINITPKPKALTADGKQLTDAIIVNDDNKTATDDEVKGSPQ